MSDKEGGCIFCEKPKVKDPADEYILYNTRHSFVMLNLYPYNNGHLLIAPFRHESNIFSLPANEQEDLLSLVPVCERIITEAYNPAGINIGVNVGSAAGAGYKEHVHIHLVPRWHGDTSFMTICSDTRVVPETLKQVYQRLLPYFNKL